MLFNSIDFLIFLPIVLVIYYIIPMKYKHIWLLISSYYFYMCWNAKYVLLIFVSTVITYLSGILIDKVEKTWPDVNDIGKYKKLILALSFVSNLGILFYFKYINFTLDIVTRVLSKVNISMNVPVFDVILPVGISFYTFQALSYSVDVYRGEVAPEHDFFRYALFVSFFPQLVAGPIERSKNLLTQLREPRKFDFGYAFDGILLMLWGFFLKIVLADRIAIFVDTVYGDCEHYQGIYLIVATVLFAVQIYCDFSGYSSIAMGTAKLLGIELMDNFNAPYLSTSVADFWRRWHISLTSWFKDYLYIPLGGSKKGILRKYLNKMIVFMLSGLWHGAQLTFVVWGAINGLYQVIGEILMPIRKKVSDIIGINRNSEGFYALSALATFALVDFTWIFFRADSLGRAIYIIKSILNTENIWTLFDGSLYNCGLDEKNFRLMVIAVIILLIADILKRKGIRVREIILRQDGYIKCLVVSLSILMIMVFGKYGPAYDAVNFIYFQF